MPVVPVATSATLPAAVASLPAAFASHPAVVRHSAAFVIQLVPFVRKTAASASLPAAAIASQIFASATKSVPTNMFHPIKSMPTNPSANNNVLVSTKTTASNSMPALGNVVKGGKHLVGSEELFVPKKGRTTGVKRKIEEVGQVGTQQSVNKP